MDNLSKVEDVTEKNIFIYIIDIEDGNFVGKLARRSTGNYEKTVKLPRDNNHTYYINNIDHFFKCQMFPMTNLRYIFQNVSILQQPSYLLQNSNQNPLPQKRLHSTRDVVWKSGWVQY